MGMMQASRGRDLAPGTIFLMRGEWYRKMVDTRIDGQLYNCTTVNMNEPDYVMLDEWYYVKSPA